MAPDPTGQCPGVLFGNKDLNSSSVIAIKGKVNVIQLMSIASKMYSKKPEINIKQTTEEFSS